MTIAELMLIIATLCRTDGGTLMVHTQRQQMACAAKLAKCYHRTIGATEDRLLGCIQKAAE